MSTMWKFDLVCLTLTHSHTHPHTLTTLAAQLIAITGEEMVLVLVLVHSCSTWYQESHAASCAGARRKSWQLETAPTPTAAHPPPAATRNQQTPRALLVMMTGGRVNGCFHVDRSKDGALEPDDWPCCCATKAFGENMRCR